MIKFSETGRKLVDGVIPAGTTVWKKVRDNLIVEMITLGDGIIPEGHRAQIQNNSRIACKDAYGCKYTKFRKCRVPKVYVVSVTTLDGLASDEIARSNEEYSFVYTPGTIVTPDSYDADARMVCTYGIHVFLTRQEAVKYNWA